MTTEYSIQKMVSDGTLSTIALGIQYLQRNDIYMRIAGEDTPQSGASSGYTWSFVNNTSLKILPVVPNGVEVVVYRRTDIDAMYNIYSQNAQFDEATIDENNQQLLYIAQEYLEQGIPGAGVDTLEFVRDDGTYTYYRIKRTDGSYSDEFTVPSAGSATKIFAREALRRSYAEAGYTLVAGSFEAGGTVTTATDVLLYEANGTAYSWGGFLPKIVPAGSTPANSGGIGPTLWIDVGDASGYERIKEELAQPDGVNLVGGAVKEMEIGVSFNIAELQNSLSSRKSAIAMASIQVPATGLPLPSYSILEQQNGAIGFTGNTFSANNTIFKTGNATITLSNQDPNAGAATVDAIVYQEPAWPNGAVYPQKTTLRNVGIMGNSGSFNEAGIFILQGGVMSIASVDVVNCVNGLLAKDMFLSDVRKLHTLGKIRIDNGTSVTFTDCWARGHISREGAFDLNGLKYSVMNGCASDSAPNTAYAFNYCQGVTLNGCGCEGAETITTDRGTAIAFKDSNTITLNGFACVPVAGQGVSLISVGNNNRIEIHDWDSNFGQNNDTDIYIYGNGSTVEIFSSKFYNNRAPVIQIAVGSTSIVIWHRDDGNIIKYYAPASSGLALQESFFDHGVWTPDLAFSGGSTGIAYAERSGTWEKNGNQMVFHGTFTLSSKGSSTGIALINGITNNSDWYESSKPALISGMTGGPFLLAMDKNAPTPLVLIDGASGTSNASDINFTNSASMRFSIRFTLAGSRFS